MLCECSKLLIYEHPPVCAMLCVILCVQLCCMCRVVCHPVCAMLCVVCVMCVSVTLHLLYSPCHTVFGCTSGKGPSEYYSQADQKLKRAIFFQKEMKQIVASKKWFHELWHFLWLFLSWGWEELEHDDNVRKTRPCFFFSRVEVEQWLTWKRTKFAV